MLFRLMKRWARIVCLHPYLVVFFALLIAVLGGYYAMQLGIKSNFAALLPQNAQSVKDLNTIANRMGGMGTLMVLIEGDDLKAMERFTEDFVARVNAYPKEEVLFVDYTIQKQKEFFDKYQLMYLSTQELFDFREALNDRIGKEKLKASGLLVELDDEDTDDKPANDEADKEKAQDKKDEKADDGEWDW